MNPHGRGMTFPASLYGSEFWIFALYSESSRLMNLSYNILVDGVTAAFSLLSAAKEEVLEITGSSKPLFVAHSFTKFSQLPPEIRCQIWRESFPGARVVELRDGSGQSGRLAAQKYIVPWTSPSDPPTVLHVCRESRAEALRFYEPSFSRCGFPPQIFVNFDRDIIYFGHKTRSDGILDLDGETRDFGKIQHMAIGFSGMSRLVDWQLNKLTALNDIIMVRSMTPGRYFKIGKSPKLVEFEQDDRDESEYKMDVTRAIAMYVRRLNERQEELTGWEVPLVKVGMMVRTASDGRYY